MSPALSPEKIDALVRDMVFGADTQAKQAQIREMAFANGLFFASIQNLYDAMGKKYGGFTVPAVNVRGVTFDFARAMFKSAIKNKVGPFVFEIARSELAYTKQTPGEFAAAIIAGGLAEGYKGPVFLQCDHCQVNAKNYQANPGQEMTAIMNLIKESIAAGFYNIDIDASTMVDMDKADLLDQQEANGRLTAELTKFIRSVEPKGWTISVGGEIGEIGHTNSTVEDLRAYMQQYRKNLPAGMKGISKISVQTGTTHGGIVLPDGSIAKVQLDFDTLEKLSKLAREEFGMGGAVQHGASTLPDDMFDLFPRKGTMEVHLATGFQNMFFDSPYFPKDLLDKINKGIEAKYPADRKPGEADVQFYYRNRKRSFGDFKQEIWDIPQPTLDKIFAEIEERFTFFFKKLNVAGTNKLVAKLIKPVKS
ncbi:MAG: class II fructose-bisphosphate aldolase [Dehalococcoidales bacterium]